MDCRLRPCGDGVSTEFLSLFTNHRDRHLAITESSADQPIGQSAKNQCFFRAGRGSAMKGSVMKTNNAVLKASFMLWSVALLLLSNSRGQSSGIRQADAALKKTATATSAGKIVRNNIGMQLVYVPAGSFMMGSTNAEVQEVYAQTQRDGEQSQPVQGLRTMSSGTDKLERCTGIHPQNERDERRLHLQLTQ